MGDRLCVGSSVRQSSRSAHLRSSQHRKSNSRGPKPSPDLTLCTPSALSSYNSAAITSFACCMCVLSFSFDQLSFVRGGQRNLAVAQLARDTSVFPASQQSTYTVSAAWTPPWSHISACWSYEIPEM